MFRPGSPHFVLRFAVLVVTLALTMRVAVPEGFMLAPGGGMPHLMLCDGMEPSPEHGAMAAMHHDAGQHGGKSTPERPCAFSAAAFSADLATPVAAPAPAPALPAIPARHIFDVRPGAGLAAPPPWQTGPPATA